MRLVGLDPGLRVTGWGVIELDGTRLRHVANGKIGSDAEMPTAERLLVLFDGLVQMLERMRPDGAAVEETFVNVNASSTLKLGLARGISLLAPARCGIPVAEYASTAVKKSVVGVGHAAKPQVQAMIARLLPGVVFDGPDAADALAVALCHGHHLQTRRLWVAPGPMP